MASLLVLLLAACADEPAAGEAPARVGDAAGLTAPAPRPSRLAEFQAVAVALREGSNPILGRAEVPRLRQELGRADLAPRERLDLQVKLADKLLQLGEEEQALELMQGVVADAKAAGDQAFVHYGLARLAVCWLRLAEVENCIARHNSECCIFPLAGGAVHEQRVPAERARDTLLEYLALDPGNLQALWLLNVAVMALGEWPAGVPGAWRLPADAFASAQDPGRFVDVAPELGLDTFNLCGGVVVDDLDGDGLLDVLTSTFDPEGPVTFYRRLEGGGFRDDSDASGASDQLGGLNMVAADYDDDGDVDVLVLRGAWLYDDGRIRNSLLRNEGDGTLVDVTRELGLADPAQPTQSAAWADLDGDGDLDLYVGNESRLPADVRGDYPGQLFRNDGPRGFQDVARQAGVTNDLYCKGVAAGDVDDDGDVDLYISNVGPNRLYRNEGSLTFQDVAPALGVSEPEGRSFATWFFDYDNDGHLDLFVGGFQATVGDLAAEALGRPHQAVLPRLYRNGGDGTLADVTAAVGLARPFLPMGANFGDIDEDGWLDIYLTTGDPLFETLMPNAMLRNDEGRRFVDVSTAAGLGHLQKGHGVGFADIDHDGDQDIYHQLGGFYPADKYHNALFLNPGHAHRFLYVQLVGTTSNRAGFGARLRVVVSTPAGSREIHRAPGSVSSFGGSPARQEIGLGDATAIERVEVRWPVSGRHQVFNDVPLDVMIRITEDQDGWERLPLPPAPLPLGR